VPVETYPVLRKNRLKSDPKIFKESGVALQAQATKSLRLDKVDLKLLEFC
jgi:hypothetical protein